MKKLYRNTIFAALFFFQGVPDKQPTPEDIYHREKLTLNNVIDALSEYSLFHQELPIPGGFAYGVTNHMQRKIYINSEQNRRDAIDTILHEMYHIKFYREGFEITEEMIDAIVKLTVKDMKL